MTGTIYSGTYLTGIGLFDPTMQETITITGTVSNTNGDAIFGNNAFPWTVNNQHIIANYGSSGQGVQLLDGGTVNNQTSSALIEGYFQGVLIKGAAGVATNFGTIESTGTNSQAISFTEGGRVVNGSAADTTAQIAGGSNAVVIGGAPGTVTNFGTMTSTRHSVIVLGAGGTVTNGSALSHAALIAGTAGGSGIYVNGGLGVVTNFGSIVGSAGINLHTGGTVTNGNASATAATITGTGSNAVLIQGAAGTVTNLGTIEAAGTSTSPSISLIEGGSVTNGSTAVTGALLSASATTVYITHGAGSLTNFGVIINNSLVRGTTVAFEYGGNITNTGTIENAETANAAVYIRGGGSVTNATNGAYVGLISSVNTGVGLRGGASTVTNSGSIQSSVSHGVYLNGGGAVTNQIGGLIEGGLNGIYNRGVAISVTNAGTIESTGTGGGIYLRGGGSVTNQAGGTIAGAAYGIETGRQGRTVTNAGLISGTVGVLGTTGGNLTLINSGTISSTSGTAGTAVALGNGVSKGMLVVEAGSTFIGAVNGGGQGEIDFVPGGTANMAGVFGFTTVELGNGASHSLTLTNADFAGVSGNRITVIGGDSGNTVDASAVTFGPVTLVGGAGTDALTGGASSDLFEFTAAALTGGDTVSGGGGFDNELLMTTAGTVTATGVTGVEIFQLANGGANTLKLTNGNFVGVNGGFIRVYGGNAGNTVNGAGVTTGADRLIIYGGAGADHLTGGAGDDVFIFTPATLTATDTVAGGGGTNEVLMTGHGTIKATGVSGVQNIVLASGGSNTLALTSANFTGVGGHLITVIDGNSGNLINASTLSSTDEIAVYAGKGADILRGGAGNDIFYAGGKTTMTGGAGTNEFTFDHIGSNVITDFTGSATNEIVFSNSGFNLGLGGATSTPQALSASLIGNLTTGAFSNTTQRFAYNQTTGQLLFGADGNGGASHVVAKLTGDPALSASHLFFVT